MKSGWRTSEFWLTVAVQIVPLLVLLNVMTGPEAETLAQSIEQAVKALAALAGAVAPVWRYIESRKAVKLAAVEIDQ